jgi:hypothetical protein
MKLIALPWRDNLRYHYGKKLYCCWMSESIIGRWYYNWNDADAPTFSASKCVGDLSIYWGGRSQYATSEEKAKQLADIGLVKAGWTLLEPGDRLLTLL